MILETERTVVREWRETDIPAYAEIVADPEVMRFIGNGSVHTYDHAAAFVCGMIRNGRERGWTRWAVEHKATGALMGFCGCDVREELLDFGYCFARAFWGQGLGTEVAQAVLDHGLATYELEPCTALAYVANQGSLRILETIGFTFDRHGELYGKTVAYYRYGD